MVKLQCIDKEAKQKAELARVRTEMKLQRAQAKLEALETARDFADEKSQLAPEVLFTNPSARAGYDTRSIFKRSLTGFEFRVFLLLD